MAGRCSLFKPLSTRRQCRICSLTRTGVRSMQRMARACSIVKVFSLFLGPKRQNGFFFYIINDF